MKETSGYAFLNMEIPDGSKKFLMANKGVFEMISEIQIRNVCETIEGAFIFQILI